MMKIINTTVSAKKRRERSKNIALLSLTAMLVSTFGLTLGASNTAYASEQVCSSITLASGSTTQTAGYTETNPVGHSLAVASYAHTYNLATNTVTVIPPWIDPLTNMVFSGAQSRWISSATTSPGASSTEGLASRDQWRLFQDSFVIPANATVTSADVWYTGDNAVAVFSNGTIVQKTGGAVDDVFGLVPPDKPAVYGSVYHTTFSPLAGTNMLNFVVRNWGGAFTSNPTGLLYKAVVNYCGTTGTTTTPPTNTSGSITIKKVVMGGTATSADFQIHVMKGGVEVMGSPQNGTASGTMYSGLATSSSVYTVSETGGPANYGLAISGDCSVYGNVMISDSVMRSCTLTNTFVGTSTTPTTTPPVPPTPEAGPRQDKQNVLDELIALRDEHAACSLHMKQLNVAIVHLQASLADELWVDNDHVSAHEGDKVFDEEQESVKALQKLMEDSDNDVDDALLQGFTERLAQADRNIASIAIGDATYAGAPHWKIVRANKMLTRGDTAYASNHVLRAMWRFQKAWGFAMTSY